MSDWIPFVLLPLLGLLMGVGAGYGLGRRDNADAQRATKWKYLALLAADECIRMREKYEPE